MPLNIKNDHTHALAKKLAELTHTSITDAVDTAIREAIERRQARSDRIYRATIEELREIAKQAESLPVYDRREADQILGYDEHGVLH